MELSWNLERGFGLGVFTMRSRIGVRLLALLSFLTIGCAEPGFRQPAGERAPLIVPSFSLYTPPLKCKVPNIGASAKTLEACKDRARSGDVEAAMEVGETYLLGLAEDGRDTREGVYWYTRAADLGSVDAMRRLHYLYLSGNQVPKNEEKAEEYLLRAAGAGAKWAQLLIAGRLEKSDPPKALDLYLGLARGGSCAAQGRLANAYYDGDLTSRNLTHAYFWLLLAKSGGCRQEVHGLERTLDESLPADHVRLAQRAASDWKQGEREPSLPGPTVVVAPASPERRQREAPRRTESPRPPAPPTVAIGRTPTAVRWAPLPQSAWRPRLDIPLDPVRLFEVASQSVWLVSAARSAEELARAGEVVVGSAIAVTSRLLLTNFHLMEGRPFVRVEQGGKVVRAAIAFGDSESDRCILSIETDALVAVRGMRGYGDLKVGEEVYTIGSPSGLEATLGQGVISGLRTLGHQRLLQTSAPISPGSSGGGLFDKSGNLVGITSFRLREGQNLNFAISVEEYFQ